MSYIVGRLRQLPQQQQWQQQQQTHHIFRQACPVELLPINTSSLQLITCTSFLTVKNVNLWQANYKMMSFFANFWRPMAATAVSFMKTNQVNPISIYPFPRGVGTQLLLTGWHLCIVIDHCYWQNYLPSAVTVQCGQMPQHLRGHR